MSQNTPLTDAELQENISLIIAKSSGMGPVVLSRYATFQSEEIMALIHSYTASQVREAEKAYGGCRNCYGKGYATTTEFASGHATDGDIGGPEGYFKWKLPGIKYCKCDRGKQLKKLQKGTSNE